MKTNHPLSVFTFKYSHVKHFNSIIQFVFSCHLEPARLILEFLLFF